MNAENNVPRSGPKHATSRRTVLRTAGATALAASFGATALGTAHAGQDDATADVDNDVIVIGAGFAGVTAARELSAMGLRTLILEGRKRIGGRVWTTTFAGEQVELGGTWVDERQPNVWKEIQRYGIKLTTDVVPTRAILPTATGFGDFDPAVAYARQSELFTPLFDGSREYFEKPYEPLYREALVRDRDKLTMRARLDQMRYSADEERWILGSVGALTGSPTTIGLATMAQWWALSGWNYDGYTGVNTYRPEVGSTGLLNAILKDSTARLSLDSPVASVADDGTKVIVTTRAGQVHTARAVVVAVPVNLWNSIKFTPGLPAEYTKLSTDGLGVRSSQKFLMHVRGTNLDQFYVEAPPGSPVALALPFKARSDGNIMIGFSASTTFDASNRADLQREMRKFVPGIEVVAVKAQHWGQDPFSKGGWAVRKAGILTGPLKAVQQPWGKVAFASSDIAVGWHGFIDGAIESGFTATSQVVKTLGL
ncbi:FAD-dependent oxidoreductase [Streptomyces sp. 2A115]|uniref:FAD-dependent oxidoreductase n=1 Tax=Streptomyces sp. 2A115 TaxID=3457439 RepID=UPI003FD50388